MTQDERTIIIKSIKLNGSKFAKHELRRLFTQETFLTQEQFDNRLFGITRLMNPAKVGR